MSRSPRQLCVRALAEWQRGKLFADEILDGLRDRNQLSSRDRGWLREAFYGTIRHLSQIDFLIGRLRDGEVDAETRAILRLGLYQLFHMRAPSHAVVNETVELAGRTRGLINAILRRALREKDSLERALASAPDEVRLAHPAFLIQRWEKQFGRE